MPKDLLYVALGDSTGVGVGAPSGGGYPDRLLRMLALPSLRLLNLCESGATSADVITGQLPRALKTRPLLITIGIGINDVGLQIPDESFAVNLETIVVALRKLGARMAINNIPDLALAPAVTPTGPEDTCPPADVEASPTEAPIWWKRPKPMEN